MSKTGHTPGPWQTVRNNAVCTQMWELLGHDTLRIVFGPLSDVAYCPAVDGDNGNANARLIAAAPKLLQACKLLVSTPCDCRGCKAGRAAIAEAEAPR